MFDPNKLLEPQLRVKSAANHLHRIGFCIIGSDYSKNSLIYKPIVVFAIPMLYLIERLLSLRLTDNRIDLQIIFGDFTQLLGFGCYLNYAVITMTLLLLSLQ